ncbi:hypothetical protein C8F04DRAFT_1340815 [Mycena alexandri]|uniref:Uncharacterized protein n=1 Tax=Mycena alexandri TaxID=1745969 RepID=A0AAD6SYL2_9AGAR|nr:hypothetical protein C8F04DRAFT_1340815 [Mycena alexandri]
MPTAAKEKAVPDGFVSVEAGTKLLCTLCTALSPIRKETRIAYTSLAAHLKSGGHGRAVEFQAAATIRATQIQQNREDDLARRREAEMNFSGLRDVQIPTQQQSRRIQTAAETQLWEELDADPHSAGFDLGTDKATQQYNDLCGEMNSIWNAGVLAQDSKFSLGEGNEEVLQEDDEEDFLAEIMQNAAINDPDHDGQDILDVGTEDPDERNAEWAPYPSKMASFIIFLWILKESGAQGVPSFDHLRKVQKKNRERCGIPTTQYTTAMGNVFYMNDPRTLIAKDWANPETRKLIHVYPEIPEDGVIREIWHAQKWRKTMDLDHLSPMYDAKHLSAHFYVNELARLNTGQLVIPIRWLKFRDSICADAFLVDLDDAGVATVADGQTVLIAAQDLVANYLDLEDDKCLPKWSKKTSDSGHPTRMPNPKRAIANGDPMYTSFIDYFGDDVSGNRSKSWNKHWNAYLTHRNLPRQVLAQEFHVHFISTSPHASITEQFTAFKSVMEGTHKDPIRVRDAETQETTCVCIHANAGPSDNPMQSEISGHIGAKGNFFCRKCKAGGSDKDKEENTCFHSLFSPGEPRSKDKILTELKNQVKLACSGVAQPIKNAQTDTGIKDAYTQHWIKYLLDEFQRKKQEDPERSSDEIEEELIQWTLDNEDKIYSGFLTVDGFDPTKDTPVEILHTILLGVVKYIWHSSHIVWTADQKKIYSVRLQSTNTDGLTIHAIRAPYIMQYANSLIGRQFKTIAQVNIFHVHGLVTPEQFTTWQAVGQFAALLWVPEIHNLDEYIRDVEIAAGNVMDAFAVVDPTKILTKIKLHLLPHTPEDIIAFGPLVGVATEIYEAFNAVFRFCSILSNHLAPSRDIALQLADQEGLKHRLTGGWWPNSEGEWERAGAGVRGFLATRPVLQKLVGWTIETPAVAGSTKLVPLPKRKKGVPRPVRSAIYLGSTHASQALNSGAYDLSSRWFLCRAVIAASLDECKKDSWVFVKSPITGTAVIVLDVFQVLETRHDAFGMPVLARRQGEPSFIIVPSLVNFLPTSRFLYNTQHDCHVAECEATGERPRMQERVESKVMEKFIVHRPVERFIINTHAFHNAHLLRQVLPRALVAPVPLFPEREVKHHELAAKLREIKNGKRKRRLEKAEEKRKNAEDTRAAKKSARKTRDKQRPDGTEGSVRVPASDVDSSEDEPTDTEDEAPPRKRQKRRRVRPDDIEESDSDYGGDRVPRTPVAAPRVSGRARKLTARAKAARENDLDIVSSRSGWEKYLRTHTFVDRIWKSAVKVNVLFAPGGYLNEETSDTQVFGFSESQSRSGGGEEQDIQDLDFDPSRGYSQGDPANPCDPASPQYPAAQAYLRRCSRSLPPSPPAKRQKQEVLPEKIEAERKPTVIVSAPDDVGKAEYLTRLATLLSGSQFSDGEPASKFPMLKRFGGARTSEGILFPETIQEETDHEKEFLRRFSDECWRSSPSDLQEFRTAFRIDPNALQYESLLLFRKLVAHMPLLVHTVMDPYRAETMSRILESMSRIVHGLQLLARVQSRAQEQLAMEPLD